MNARERDTMSTMVARAHAEAVRVPKREAMRMGISARSARRWCSEGPPHVRQMALYLDGHPNPHRILANLRAMAEADVQQMTKADLIAEYRRLLGEECEVEAVDRRGTMFGTSWVDTAAESERDAAIDLRKAAIERQFEARRITREEVRNG